MAFVDAMRVSDNPAGSGFPYLQLSCNDYQQRPAPLHRWRGDLQLPAGFSVYLVDYLATFVIGSPPMIHPTTSNDLTTVFVQFASGFHDLPARQRFLEAHPELLSQPAIVAANAFIRGWHDRGFPQASLIRLRLFRNLLQRAMAVGVEPACQKFAPAPPEMVEALAKLLRAGPGYSMFNTMFVVVLEAGEFVCPPELTRHGAF